MYIITARRMTSGELLKYRNGLFISADYESLCFGSSRFSLPVPVRSRKSDCDDPSTGSVVF